MGRPHKVGHISICAAVRAMPAVNGDGQRQRGSHLPPPSYKHDATL